MYQISELASNIVPSMTVELKGKIAELRKHGRDIIGLTSGEPDMATPENIQRAAKRAIEEGRTKYTPAPGIMALREAICAKLKEDFDLNYKPNQTCVSTGAKQALFNAVMAVCNVGDEVLLPTPCWVSYTEQIKMIGAVPVLAPMEETSGYQLDFDALDRACTPKTRMIIINNPNNPTGTVYSRESLEDLARFVEKRDLMVIADEIYEKLLYGSDSPFFSFPTISQYAYENTILINGWSKAYSMTGWRIGYAAAALPIIKAMSAIQGHITYGANTIAQYAALEAYTGPQQSVEEMRREFEKRRDYLQKRLNNIPLVSCNAPTGAFYLLPNISAYYGCSYGSVTIDNSLDLCNYLIEHAGVAFVPGDSFYAPKSIRVSYACSFEDIEEGINRLEVGLAILRKSGGKND